MRVVSLQTALAPLETRDIFGCTASCIGRLMCRLQAETFIGMPLQLDVFYEEAVCGNIVFFSTDRLQQQRMTDPRVGCALG